MDSNSPLRYRAVAWLEISIEGCKSDCLQENSNKKEVTQVSGLNIDGCMDSSPQIDGMGAATPVAPALIRAL